MFKRWLMNSYGSEIPGKALKHIVIIGSGSWATALVKIFSESGVLISWLVRDNDQAVHIVMNGRNPRYLSFAALHLPFIMPSTNIEKVLADAELVIFAVPAAYLADTLIEIKPEWVKNKAFAASIKGFIPGSGCTPAEYIRRHFNRTEPVSVIAGPCHAEEIAMQRNTYITVAGENISWVNKIGESIKAPYMHVVSNNDPTGVEYVSILKNITGIATGIASGLNYGANFQAVLVSNFMREIGFFLNAASPKDRCLCDSVYFGDLLVTAYSDLSRNRILGKLIGRGIHINKAIQSMAMIAEGYYASKELSPLVHELGISLPVINSIYRILHQHANPFHEFKLIEKQLR